MLAEILTAIERMPAAEMLRASRYVYPVVNAVHILALATLVGAITCLDLRLVGLARSVPAAPLAALLPRVAGTGLAVAVVSGLLLFGVRPGDYAANPAFLLKLGLVVLGTAHALAVHRSQGWRVLRLSGTVTPGLAASGALSLAIWVSAVFAGRFIAFLE